MPKAYLQAITTSCFSRIKISWNHGLTFRHFGFTSYTCQKVTCSETNVCYQNAKRISTRTFCNYVKINLFLIDFRCTWIFGLCSNSISLNSKWLLLLNIVQKTLCDNYESELLSEVQNSMQSEIEYLLNNVHKLASFNASMPKVV